MVMNRLFDFSAKMILTRLGVLALIVGFCGVSAQEGMMTGDTPAAPKAAPAASAHAQPRITGATVGIGGAWKAGFAAPVTVFIADGAPNADYLLEIGSVDPDKSPTVVRIPFRYEGSESAVSGLFWPGKSSADLEIAVWDVDGTRCLTRRVFSPAKPRENRTHSDDSPATGPETVLFPAPLAAERPLWLSTGSAPNGLTEAAAIWRPEERERPQVVPVGSFVDLPTDRRGYDAVDILFISGSEEGFFDSVSAEDPRFNALEEWIQSGGRLVITGGGRAAALFRPGGPLARFVPGTVEEKTKEIRIANDLVQFVPKAKNLVMTGTLDHPFLELPVLRPAEGTFIDLSEGETPLIVRQVRSFGTVTWFAGDSSAPPLSNWNGRDGLWLGILGVASERRQAPRADSGLVQLGYSDLSGQLRSALDRFDGVRNFPFSLILILIGVYVLAIGPLDWFITHRLLKRPNLTWITLPLWLILFSAAALAIETRIRPTQRRVNQVELIDWDEASARVRGTAWVGMFSPADERFDLTLIPAAAAPVAPSRGVEIDFAWLGLSGSGLGATEQKMISPAYWSEPYEIGRTDGLLKALPIRVRSSKSLFGTWLAETASETISDFTLKNDYLTGTVTNRLDRPIEDAILYSGPWAYQVGTLAPGETFSVDRKTPRIDSARIYGGADDPFNKRLSNTMTQSGLERYNTRSTDPETILRMMMFHAMAGGDSQTGLSNARHHLLDSGELLRAGRAVLTGKIASGEQGAFGGCGLRIAEREAADDAEIVAPNVVYIRLFCPVK